MEAGNKKIQRKNNLLKAGKNVSKAKVAGETLGYECRNSRISSEDDAEGIRALAKNGYLNQKML